MINIYWDAFTPGSSLAGGLLIGAAAAMLVLGMGRIMGISGIVGALLTPRAYQSVAQWGWRLAFVAGLVAAPWVWQMFAPLPPMTVPDRLDLIVVAGLLVGFGTRLGSGCTSGHGVCGLSRLSLRSLVATVVFMAFGMLTVWLGRHVLA